MIVVDASVVATALAFGAVLLTADTRLATAPGTTCAIELIEVAGGSG